MVSGVLEAHFESLMRLTSVVVSFDLNVLLLVVILQIC